MNTLQMQIIAILSGNFSEKGNFSGYNAAGQRVHIAGRQMESLGHTPESVKTKPITFPLYTIAVEREFNVLDENGEPKAGETFTRVQAGSVFATKADAIGTYNSDKMLTLESAVELRKSATALGLTEESVKALESATI